MRRSEGPIFGEVNVPRFAHIGQHPTVGGELLLLNLRPRPSDLPCIENASVALLTQALQGRTVKRRDWAPLHRYCWPDITPILRSDAPTRVLRLYHQSP